ncbi:MAG: M42 family metallopeptidase [Clostridia bacterium]|jgi:putative aminopeptidase FrvX|nr:M42 family metallopeptidase [Clostridia bacterium]
MFKFDENYCIETFRRLLAVDSTTGQYEEIETLTAQILDELGYPYERTHKGGIIADLGGEGDPLVVSAHLDDIGLMVRHINADGTLNVCPVGGLYPFYCMMENVRIHTRDGKVYTGCVCRNPNSVHVTEEELRLVAPDFRTNVCVVLDENVKSAADTRALGIETGDMIALEPRFVYANGYLKSHFVDDKACVAVLLAAMKELKEKNIKLNRKVYAYFAAYEEIGHGTVWMPEGVKDYLAIDIAPTGPDQNSDEKKVSIFCKDSRFPYHWGMTNELREAAIAAGVDYVMDIFTPHYGTDGDASVVAGWDIRHSAIGPGTANSHGYERTHIDGLRSTFDLLMAYLTK